MNNVKIIFLIIIGIFYKVNTQTILINEFLASNVRDSPEMHDFSDYSDWIELYNPSSQSFIFNEVFITDDLNNPLKWKIPNNTNIESESYLVIWADDYNEIPGRTHTRPYWPWDEFTTQNQHTNFKLNKSGEEIGLFKAEEPENIILIGEGALWKYLDDGSDQETGWIELGFNDDDWNSGYAELGYGDDDEITIVGYGSDENNKHITTYFRHTFMVFDPDDYQSLTLKLKRDDGAVIYLNGYEIIRANMPSGTI